MKAAVFDLDGVLFNVNERLRKCLSEVGASSVEEMSKEQRRQFWKIFLSTKYMHLDKPNKELINYISELKSKGIRIIIITGRREDTQKEYTLKQLKEAGISFDEIYFRPANYFRKDYEFKAEVVEKLIEKGYEIVEFWDDSERVVEKMKKVLRGAKIVHYIIVSG